MRKVTPKLAKEYLIDKPFAAMAENGLYPIFGKVCLWFGFIHVSMGLASLINPSLYENTAYQLAEDIFPIRVWGFIMFTSGLLLLWAGWKKKTNAARIGISIYATVQWVFGVSVLYLTVTGSYGAFAGFLQWMTGPIVAYIIVMRPMASGIVNSAIESVDALSRESKDGQVTRSRVTNDSIRNSR